MFKFGTVQLLFKNVYGSIAYTVILIFEDNSNNTIIIFTRRKL